MFARPLLLVTGFLLSLAAYAQDSIFTRLIHHHHALFAPMGHQFAGPGWEIQQRAIRQSRFVLLGEEPHGVAEIPGFADAVARMLQPNAFVADISLYESQQLNQLAAQPGLHHSSSPLPRWLVKQ